MLFAGGEQPETFRGATFLENDCHFAMIRMTRHSTKSGVRLNCRGQFNFSVKKIAAFIGSTWFGLADLHLDARRVQ